MLHPYLDWQREALAALLGFGRSSAESLAWARPLIAMGEFTALNLDALMAKRVSLEAAVATDVGGEVEHEVLSSTPFVRVLRFRGRERRRRFLFLAPYSGYATAVVSPLLTALLAHGEVVITDWADARLIPLRAGGFGHADQLRVGLELARSLGPGIDIVGLSQSGPVTLGTAAILAAEGVRPGSVTILGSQIDPRVSPRPIQRFLALCPRPIAFQLASEVPPIFAGAGRQVYPGLFQLLAFTTSRPDSYLGIQQGLWNDLAQGADRGFRRQHADVHSLIDVPAELFFDMLDWVVFQPGIADGRLRIGSREIDLKALAGVPLLTVEASEDELVGPGQAHAAHAAIGATPPSAAVTLRGLQHHMLFTAPQFLTDTAPAIQAFIAGLG